MITGLSKKEFREAAQYANKNTDRDWHTAFNKKARELKFSTPLARSIQRQWSGR